MRKQNSRLCDDEMKTIDARSLTAETSQIAVQAFESVDDVRGSDILPLGVFLLGKA